MPKTEWTDPTITANQTAVRGTHLRELQAAVNNWRTFYGLPPTTFSENIVDNETLIKPQEHVTALRTAVDQLRQLAGLGGYVWTDAVPVTMRKPYIDELRGQVNNLENNHCYQCDTCDIDDCNTCDRCDDGCGFDGCGGGCDHDYGCSACDGCDDGCTGDGYGCGCDGWDGSGEECDPCYSSMDGCMSDGCGGGCDNDAGCSSCDGCDDGCNSDGCGGGCDVDDCRACDGNPNRVGTS